MGGGGGGCHGNMATVCLSSIPYSSNNQELLAYTLSFKNIKVLLNPVSWKGFRYWPLAYKVTLTTDVFRNCIEISAQIYFESD